jgi:hypothetical protein
MKNIKKENEELLEDKEKENKFIEENKNTNNDNDNDNDNDNYNDNENENQIESIFQKFKLTEILDELSIFNKINKNHIRYFLIKYGIDTTRDLLREIKLKKYQNFNYRELLNLQEKYGIYPEQIKFEIENLELKDTFDFILKRHNFISLLYNENRNDLFMLVKIICEISGYSQYRINFEIYKTSLFCDYLLNSNRI